MSAMDQTVYSTSEIAKSIGVHPNTIRLYEKSHFITQPERRANGYRVFTKEHLLQVQVIRLALQVEIIQSNLRKEVIAVILTMAARKYIEAIALSQERLKHIERDQQAAEQAIETVNDLMTGKKRPNDGVLLTRSAAAESLSTTIDSLRNWEMNGLFSAKRKRNGYRVYTSEDIERLRVIKVLRDANYSIAAIHRLFSQLKVDPGISIRDTLDTPTADEDILSVCDELLTSLALAKANSYQMIEVLHELESMK